ncbi:unnamed protein product [Adineta ricciae]|uniref:Uncharacterized protein n=1 Tax=Adineta ricciae TaxID=249248 RepID=A0A815QQR9_ADIRI|nr:unnamed protein product [Adineta ricciae]CAF1466672.1 unnamed protein product [Adineta ricciae]
MYSNSVHLGLLIVILFGGLISIFADTVADKSHEDCTALNDKVKHLITIVENLTDRLSQYEQELKNLKNRITALEGNVAINNKKNKNTPLRANLIAIHPNTTWQHNGIIVAGGNGAGKENHQLNQPLGLYVDDDETIYVAEWSNNRIMKWKSGATSGQVVAGGNGAGSRLDQLSSPRDVIIDKEKDSLFICDRSNKRVVQWPRHNGTNGKVIISNVHCWSLTMDDSGSLYISDDVNNEVRRYGKGEFQGIVVAGGNGKGNSLDQLSSPTYIFVDRDYSVYVSDADNNRVMKWVKDAKQGIVVAGGLGKGNELTQLSNPEGIVVDQLGSVYVADMRNNRIVRWMKGATKGSVISDENNQENRINQLRTPIGLSFDRQGNLYVAELGNHRVQKFNINSKGDDELVFGGIYQLIHIASDKCLNIHGAGTSRGANVQILKNHKGKNQIWLINANDDGTIKLINPFSRKVLDVSGGHTSDGTNVQIWIDNETNAQKWRLQSLGDGIYKLIHASSGKVLDVRNDETNVQIWSENNSTAQSWRLVPLVLSKDKCSDFNVKENWDYWGNDIDEPIANTTFAECYAKCCSDGRCNAFTWNRLDHKCFLKSSIGGGGNSYSDGIAGSHLDVSNLLGVFQQPLHMETNVTYRVESNTSEWHSTGYYVAPNTPIKIDVLDQAGGSGWSVRIGCHTDNLVDHETQRRPPLISLSKSLSFKRIQMSSQYGGLLFLESPDASGCSITVSLHNIILSPTYDLTNAQRAVNWRHRQRHAQGTWTDIAGRHIVFNLPSRSVLNLTKTQLDAALQFWDSVILASHNLRGTKPTHRERIVADIQPSVGYMHSGYPIVTQMNIADPKSDQFVFNTNFLKKNGSWGIFHEIGHNLQRDWWTFDGTTEVTSNIFTLYVLDTICHIRPGIHTWNREAISNTRQYIENGANFTMWKEDSSLALHIYAQLAREFDWKSYKSVFLHYERIKPSLSNNQEKIDYWIETFSRQVQQNLVPLFKFWGFPISQPTINTLSSLKIANISDDLIQIAPHRYRVKEL